MAGQININKTAPSNSTVNKASENYIGSYYLADAPQYYEPQRSNTFTFYATGINGMLDESGFGSAPIDATEEQVLELSVKASTVPHFNIDKLTINRGNSQMHFAGKPTFDDGQITVHDYIGAHTKEVLLAWQRKAYDVRTEKVGLAKDYKRDCYLLEHTPDFQLVRTWVLRGCWVSKISETNYDHDSADNRTMDVTIVYDKAYIDYSDVEEG